MKYQLSFFLRKALKISSMTYSREYAKPFCNGF